MLKRTDLERMAQILGGLLMWRSSTRGDAARAGVRQGDILLAANGIPTPDVAAFMRARRLRDDGATLDLFRYGRRLRIEVEFSDHHESSSGRPASHEARSASIAA
jgi:S1-C subfamily serine protease